MKSSKAFVIVRGGGDLATGIIHRLQRAGFRVLILETAKPAAIRRQVAFCEAVYDETATVEEVTAKKIELRETENGRWITFEQMWIRLDEIWKNNQIPLAIDSEGELIRILKPDILVDAIIAKKNLGTSKDMAAITIGIGPGFTAGQDVDYVVETMRGHDLGRIIIEGSAVPNTGIPGKIGGYSEERVIHADENGILYNICRIGDVVDEGDEIAYISTYDSGQEKRVPVNATISGIIRGLIRDSYPVNRGFKIADIDPRCEEQKNCYTISDKARCIAGSVLELACLY